MSRTLPQPFFVLAPMDDVTDTVFRRVVHDCAPADIYVTEFVNVDGLCSMGREKLLPKLSLAQDKGLVIAQIWGKKPENFEQVAKELSTGVISGFIGIDLNFGCPDKAVLKNECCSALAQPDLRDKACQIIEATLRGAGSMPVSIKTRLGFDKIDYSWHELLLSYEPSMLTVHMRTTRQMSKVPAQWEAILPIIELRNRLSPDTKIVLNGDIIDRDHGYALATKYGVDGIMIGRGVFQNPYCFAEQAESVWALQDKDARINLLENHFSLFQQTYADGQRRFAPLKKFAKIYVSDFAGASELRVKIMESDSLEEALTILNIK